MHAFYHQGAGNPPILTVGPVAVGMTFQAGPPISAQGDDVAASTPFVSGTTYTVTQVFPITGPAAGQNSAQTGGRNSAGVHDGSDGGPRDVVVLSPAPNDLEAAAFGFPTGSVGTNKLKYLRRLG